MSSSTLSRWKKGGLFILIVAVLGGLAFVAYPLLSGRPITAITGQGLSSASISVGVPAVPDQLRLGDGQAGLLLDNVYEGLTSLSSDNRPVAGLAELPEVSSDARTYTFHLRQGLRFSNGDPLTAADVVRSLQQAIEGSTVAADQLRGLSNVSNPDSSTVIIKLSAPKPDLLWTLAGEAGMVQSERKAADKSATTPVALGSGPFTIRSFAPGKSLTLERNSNYWGPKSALKTVHLQAFASTDGAIAALKAGRVQAITSLGQAAVTALNGQNRLVAQAGMGTTSVVLRFNMGPDSAGSYLILRQAFRRSIDKGQVAGAIGGAGQALSGPITPLEPGYDNFADPVPADPATGRSNIFYLYNVIPHHFDLAVQTGVDLRIAQNVAAQLAQAGLSLTPQPLNATDWQNRVEGGAGSGNQFNFGLSLVNNYFSPTQYAAQNKVWYSDDSTTTSLLDTALTATSQTDFSAGLTKAAQAASALPYSGIDPLLVLRTTNAWSADISGFPVNLTDSRLPLAAVTKR